MIGVVSGDFLYFIGGVCVVFSCGCYVRDSGGVGYIFYVYNRERESMYVNTPTEWSVLEYPRQVDFEIENFGVIVDIE